MINTDKKIRIAKTHGQTYYVCDICDIFGKRKRLYGKTEEELKQRLKSELDYIEQYKNTLPVGCRLKDFVLYYFRKSVGSISGANIKRLVNLFENAVFDSTIDRNMNELTVVEIQEFYNALSIKYAIDNIKDIDIVMGNVFEITNKLGRTNLDYNSVLLPEMNNSITTPDYIATAAELDKLLDFCLIDNCRRYKTNELSITFMLFTGLAYNEIIKIFCKDVDLDKSELKVNGRMFCLDERTTKWLKKMDEEEKLHISDHGDEEKLFVNSTGFKGTLDSIIKSCGLPKTITRKSLHKACIIRKIEEGASPADLYKKYGYKRVEDVISMYDEYCIVQKLFY